jgi:glycosyltransferase involved in cell wall biosynthesis
MIPLKILIISGLGFWDYGPRYEIFIRFARRGHEIHYIFPLNEKSKRELHTDNVFFYAVKIPFISDKNLTENFATKLLRILLFYLFTLVRALQVAKIVRPHIVYGYGEHCVIQAYLVSKIFQVPFVIRLQGIEASKKLSGREVKTFLYNHPSKLLLSPFLYEMVTFNMAKLAADAIIITNDGTQGNILANYFGIPREKLRYWFNGVNFGRLNSQKFDVELVKRELGIQSNTKIIISLCRLEKWKGVHRLIEAVPSVIDKRKDIVFLIVGDGPERKRLIQLVEKLGVQKYVRFMGHVPHNEVEKLLIVSDIFVTLQDVSCVGENLLEAMACGKCIIALNSGDTGTVIKNNINGVLLEYSDLPSLPYIILDLLTNHERMQELGENAKRFAFSTFWTWDERAKAEIELIESIVAKRCS